MAFPAVMSSYLNKTMYMILVDGALTIPPDTMACRVLIYNTPKNVSFNDTMHFVLTPSVHKEIPLVLSLLIKCIKVCKI